MKPEKDNIKDIFSSKLKSFEPDLPPLMWEKIDAGLSARQPLQAMQPVPAAKARSYKLPVWIASAAALIAAALLLFYPEDIQREGLAINENTWEESIDLSPLKETAANKEEKEEKKAENRQVAQPNSNMSLTQSTRSFIASLGSTTYVPKNEDKQSQSAPYQTITADDNNLREKDETGNGIDQLAAPAAPDKVQENTFIAENKETPGDNAPAKREVSEEELAEKIAAMIADSQKGEKLLAENNMPGRHKQKRKKDEDSPSKGFHLGASGGGTFSKANGEQIQLRKVNYAYADMANKESSNLLVDQDINLYQVQEMKMEHDQPIAFGITVSKDVSKRVSLETGIIYTYASSKYLSDEHSDLQANDSQYFHYLGLPLSVNYRLFEWNRLQVYLSAGGVIQKDIYGRIRTSQNVPASENAREYENKTISQDHPQFSLNSAVGLSYPLYKKLSIYTNVGAAYYFDAKNQYETIYSDRKWLFNLNLGIKFGF